MVAAIATIGSACGGPSPLQKDSQPSGSTMDSGSSYHVQCGPSVGVVFNRLWHSDGLTPTDTDGDGSPDTGCGDALEVFLWDYYRSSAPDDRWLFGMVDAAPGGWTGEDCFSGSGPYNLCHSVPESFTLQQVPDCDPASVVPGQTTLMHRDVPITYYIANRCECVVHGPGRSYYDALGCL